MRREPATAPGSPLDAVECARLPAAALPALAPARAEEGVTVVVEGGWAWVRWPPGALAVLRRVLPLAGVELYARRGGLWYRAGARLPAFGLPVEGDPAGAGAEARPLARVLVPAPARPEPPGGGGVDAAPLRLVRDDRPRPAAAVRCGPVALERWASGAPAARLAALRAAWDGARVLVRGAAVPSVVGGERFWGGRVLLPLGFRAEPALPEPALAAALGAGEDELAVLTADGVDRVPLAAFRTLTRAGARLAARGCPS